MTQANLLEFFRGAYCALTGNPKPFLWQEQLFQRFCKGDFPKDLDLPTGCGKTSVIAVWLLALAWEAQVYPENISLPRRLIWVVNRRVVVDQATSEAERLGQRLKEGSSELEAVRVALRNITATNSHDALAVSTLRGQLADNAAWRDDPTRPAVVIGTVDMVGSRLLFSGYGRGFKSRPLHAGFIGQDALLVHDEAHLEPAFQHLLAAVESEQTRCRDLRPLRVIALTATSRQNSADQFPLTDAEIVKRIEARKGIAFHAVDEEKKLAGEISRRALEFRESGQAILIFLRKLRDVQDLAANLQKEHLAIQQLTGTLRGYERDEMVRADPIFARFMPDSSVAPKDGTVYLLCTSAGEVGINMSAEHLVCDLTPFDSMVQRLGRVNRFGMGDARVEIVRWAATGDQPSKKKTKQQQQFEQACERTLVLLQKLPERADGRYDGSPVALRGLKGEDRLAAFTPSPTIPATSDILFDMWALTSIRGKLPGRPPVADWLHGIAEWEPPQTYVAWREEVEIITAVLQDEYKPQDLLEDYPLKPHEELRDSTDRVLEQLENIARTKPGLPAWVMEADGTVEVLRLFDLTTGDDRKRRLRRLADCTVLLPPSAGGLKGGLLGGGSEWNASTDYDIADKWTDEMDRPRRCRVWDEEDVPSGMRLVRTINMRPEAGEVLNEREEGTTRRYWRWYVRPRSADDDGSRTARKSQDLDPHNRAAGEWAIKLTSRLRLPDGEASAIVFAAERHDLGKNRELWQRSIGNRNFPRRVLAKSEDNLPCLVTGYRHEFGSLVEASRLPEFVRLEPRVRDLVLHIIGSHHGRARPHFPWGEVFDPQYADEICGEIAREVPGRFARLQREYGRWGLAYLESLVRAADALASQGLEVPETVREAEA